MLTNLFAVESYRPESWASADFTIQANTPPPPPPASPITSPSASTTWTIGSSVTITFDDTVVKNENGTLRAIELYAQSSKTPAATLATNFVSNTGSVPVTVPSVTPGSYYILSKSKRSLVTENIN